MLRGWSNSAGSDADADAGNAVKVVKVVMLFDQHRRIHWVVKQCDVIRAMLLALNLHWTRYAPHGKRSWGPTRALIGEATTQQANDYVKV